MEKAFSAFFLLFAIGYSSFGIELWNGFTTEMNDEKAINHAQEILNLQRAVITLDRTRNDMDDIPLPYITRDYDFPSSLRIISLKAGMEGLGSSNSIKTVYTNGQGYPNVIITFYDQKIFSISIYWQATNQDLIDMSRQRYGSHTSIIKYKTSSTPFSHADSEMPMWRLQGRDFFIYGQAMVIINQQVRNEYVTQREREERERRDAEEAKRNDAASRVQF